MTKSHGYAAQTKTSPLAPFSFERRDVGPDDVQIEIHFCGVCHSDIHQVRDEWGNVDLPDGARPRDRRAGSRKVGPQVKKFKVGDLAGVGCMVDSCRECRAAARARSSTASAGEIAFTYNGRYKDGTPTYGGYSNNIVVRRGVRAEGFAEAEPRRGRAAAVRGDHDVFAAEVLERRQGPARWRGRPRRARAHGAEVRPRVRRARDAVHDLAGQGSRMRSGSAPTRSS